MYQGNKTKKVSKPQSKTVSYFIFIKIPIGLPKFHGCLIQSD